MRNQSTPIFTALVVAMAIVPGLAVMAADAPEVTIQNYVRAEADLQMQNYVENMGAFGKFAYDGVPEENWLPLNRKDEEIDLILRIYVPDMEKMKTWKVPTAQKINL